MPAMHPLTLWLVLNGLPRKAFCQDARIGEPYLSDLLAGKRRPSLAVVDRISAVTDGAITAEHFPGGRRAPAPIRS